MVINPEGFVKYSSIHEGNFSDNADLSQIIDTLRSRTSDTEKRATVVIDAGIATEDNLALLQKKGYDYVCVSRKGLKDYQTLPDKPSVVLTTKGKQELTLQQIETTSDTDYYLKVKSPGKELKENSMKSQFEIRFEAELNKIHQGLSKKHTVKRFDKIQQRIGRCIQKYPSASKYYNIEVDQDEKGLATAIRWTKDPDKHQKTADKVGIYFLRTNLPISQEKYLWKVYNTIREIESSFRTLKTDLDLRPIYHKNDDATMAHLHLGVLAYWIVNTIRYQLKGQKINDSWTEIVRKANTQKVITTSGTNVENKVISIRRCSEPNQALKELYQTLQYKDRPFTKRKSVVHRSESQKKNTANNQDFTPP